MELIGPYLAASALLVAAGGAKAVRPDGSARAFALLVHWPLGRLRVIVRAVATAEVGVGLVAVVLPRPLTAALVAVSYLTFAVVVLVVRSRGGSLASCGCFGTPDTPATRLHVVVDLGLAGAAATVAAVGPTTGSIASVLARQPGAGVPLVLASAACAWLVYLALAPLAALHGARHLADATRGTVAVSTTLVERASGVLAKRLSRRSFINRSAFAGSAVAIGAGLDLALKPGTAYGLICTCGDPNCGCGSTCCAGYTEFCCSVNGGYNYCPTGTIMGGWWKADNSSFCGGPRYYMDCNATCQCETGCGDGWPFCETECDGTNCGCGPAGCDSYATGCFQFRYGQCNQDVACVGRIVCRVVACVPPWEVDPSCTTTNAEDDSTAEQNEPCWTPAPPSPPPPPCLSPATQCEVVGMGASPDGGGYGVLTSFGKLFTFGDFADAGDESTAVLVRPMVGIATNPGGGYWFVAGDGGVFAFGGAPFYGSMGGQPLNQPVVGMTARPGGGYWFVAADGGIFAFGGAPFYGSMGGQPLNQPVVGMASTPSGGGYWLVAADGGIFAFGDAPFYGSMGGQPLNQPVVGIAVTPSGAGYWMVAADGGIFAFGDAPFDGSMGGQPLNQPVVGMAAAPSGQGYWFVAADGGIFAFGVPFYGSPACEKVRLYGSPS